MQKRRPAKQINHGKRRNSVMKTTARWHIEALNLKATQSKLYRNEDHMKKADTIVSFRPAEGGSSHRGSERDSNQPYTTPLAIQSGR